MVVILSKVLFNYSDFENNLSSYSISPFQIGNFVPFNIQIILFFYHIAHFYLTLLFPLFSSVIWTVPSNFFSSRDILELDTNLPSEKVHEATDVIIQQINSTISELKRLFLVEDLVDSVKVCCFRQNCWLIRRGRSGC